MSNLDVIYQRSSIRKYQDKAVEKEKIHEILKAGFAAPSARNLRPYHFLVIDDKQLILKISKLSIGKKIMEGAPVVIAVLGDLNINSTMEFVMNDTSSCIQNMLLAIEGLNLGGCWCGQRRDETDKMNAKLLNLPENVFVSGYIALGYKAEEKVQKDRFDEKKVHYNCW